MQGYHVDAAKFVTAFSKTQNIPVEEIHSLHIMDYSFGIDTKNRVSISLNDEETKHYTDQELLSFSPEFYKEAQVEGFREYLDLTANLREIVDNLAMYADQNTQSASRLIGDICNESRSRELGHTIANLSALSPTEDDTTLDQAVRAHQTAEDTGPDNDTTTAVGRTR